MTAQLEAVAITVESDDHPPLDYLGTYQDEPGPDDRTIDRRKRGDHRRGTFRYFVSEVADHAEENYERMERFMRGELVSYGVKAEATFSVDDTVQSIESPGVWGVESDTGENYANAIASEQLERLAKILDEFGVERPDPLEASWARDAPWSGTVTE